VVDDQRFTTTFSATATPRGTVVQVRITSRRSTRRQPAPPRLG
jgi:hypothetical protein